MELRQAQYEQISDCFPKHRGSLTYTNQHVINAFLYIAENGCKWRSLPEKYGNWYTIYYRISRWAKAGVLDKAFRSLRGVGIELNYKKAFIIFQKYAQQGDGEALNAIGMMYRRGLGVKQNDEKAFRYFVQFSENGYAKAAFNLSLMYKFGNYVNQKQDSAVYWVEKAEAMGFNNTDYNIAYSRGRFYRFFQ